MTMNIIANESAELRREADEAVPSLNGAKGESVVHAEKILSVPEKIFM